jgi:hypothetical protein
MVLFFTFDKFVNEVGVVLHIWEGQTEIMVSRKDILRILDHFIISKRICNKDMVGYIFRHLYFLKLFKIIRTQK